ncbi:MAG: flagellar motor switch protein FliM [Planctomycetes bacterium]|nr:flagellar motor switch protein FliM [Planctomycetota bacterium]
MADVLEQSEVDALLAAVDVGGINDVATLVETEVGRKSDRIVAEYDFQRPERVSKEQMRSLGSLHDTFSRSFGAAMTGFLRTIVEVRVSNIEQLTFGDFIQSLPNPTCFNLLSASPLEGQMCLDLSPTIIYPIIDRLLGGSNAEMLIPQRAQTEIELRLIGRIISLALRALSEAWANVQELQFELAETESNPQLVQILPPNEVVVVVGFEIKMGGRVGSMGLCIPFNLIEPVMSRLSNQTWLNYRRRSADGVSEQAVSRRIQGASVELRAIVAESSITLADLAALAPGDIITTERDAASEIIVEVEGRRKFGARMGTYKGKKALKITRDLLPGRRPAAEDPQTT